MLSETALQAMPSADDAVPECRYRGPKVFLIGFNKCGTTSLHRFFEHSNMRVVHNDAGRLAVRMQRNIDEGRRMIEGYDEYDAYTNPYYACVHGVYEMILQFRLLVEQEPDAKFILNVRDREDWIKSRLHLYRAGAACPAT